MTAEQRRHLKEMAFNASQLGHGEGVYWASVALQLIEATEDPTFAAVAEERRKQDERWGEQNHRDGTGAPEFQKDSYRKRIACDEAFRRGDGNWRYILAEEVAEAFAETDPEKLTTELIQVMAVCKAWIECIERRPHVGNRK